MRIAHTVLGHGFRLGQKDAPACLCYAIGIGHNIANMPQKRRNRG